MRSLRFPQALTGRRNRPLTPFDSAAATVPEFNLIFRRRRSGRAPASARRRIARIARIARIQAWPFSTRLPSATANQTINQPLDAHIRTQIDQNLHRTPLVDGCTQRR